MSHFLFSYSTLEHKKKQFGSNSLSSKLKANNGQAQDIFGNIFANNNMIFQENGVSAVLSQVPNSIPSSKNLKSSK